MQYDPSRDSMMDSAISLFFKLNMDMGGKIDEKPTQLNRHSLSKLS
jgi:hypothetical protein